jgi:hypothetical protein
MTELKGRHSSANGTSCSEQIERINERRVADSDAGICSDDGPAPNWVLLELAASGLLFGIMVAAGAVAGSRFITRPWTGGA